MRKAFWNGKWHEVTDAGLIGRACAEPTSIEEGDGQAVRPLVVPITLKANEQCPACGARQEYATNKHCHKCRVEFGRVDFGSEAPEPAPVPPPPPGTKVYKVLTQRDEWFGGNFSPERLEGAVNAYAAKGWRIVGVATADVGAFWGSFMGGIGKGSRQEIVVFMENDAT